MEMKTITFKYRPVNPSGQEAGFFKCNGSLTEDELILDKSVIPLSSIYQLVRRFNRLVIVYQTDKGPVNYVIAPYDGMDVKLKEFIDRRCSSRWAEARRTQLEREGLGDAFRSTRCPACRAVLDLSGFAESPQLYCHYCERIVPADDDVELPDIDYALCDRCGFFSKSVRYTATYLVLNVISWKEHYS